MMWQFTEKGTINGIGTPSNPVYFDVNYTYLKPYTDEIINGVPESKIDLSSATVNSIDSQTYTGSSIEPSVTVTLNGKVKIKNSQIQRVSRTKSAQFAKHLS